MNIEVKINAIKLLGDKGILSSYEVEACIGIIKDRKELMNELSIDIDRLLEKAFTQEDKDYVYKTKKTHNLKGKTTCHVLREMRKKFADVNGIEYSEKECTYDGPCEGTCPYCDSKIRELANKVNNLEGAVKYPKIEIGAVDNASSIEFNRENLKFGSIVDYFDEEEILNENVNKSDDIIMGSIEVPDIPDDDWFMSKIWGTRNTEE